MVYFRFRRYWIWANSEGRELGANTTRANIYGFAACRFGVDRPAPEISAAWCSWPRRSQQMYPLLWTGNPNPAILSVSTESATTFEADFQVSIYHQLPVWLSYWFSISFLFLTITLFLVHVSIKLSGRSLEWLRKIDTKLHFFSGSFKIIQLGKTGIGATRLSYCSFLFYPYFFSWVDGMD